MNYANDERFLSELLVPLGSKIYHVVTKCGGFCVNQRSLLDEVIPPETRVRCSRELPCHTVPWHIHENVVNLANAGTVADEYGKWIFSTYEEAESRMREVVEQNRKTMRELGFILREDGYGLVEGMEGSRD